MKYEVISDIESLGDLSKQDNFFKQNNIIQRISRVTVHTRVD